VIQTPNLTVAPGTSGSFDVLLENTNAAGGASYGVSTDSLELALSGSAGVVFTDVTINTIIPYIYSVSATTLPGSEPLNFGITFPNMGFTVADADGASPFFQTVSPGDTFGLANVSYMVSPTFTGRDTITIASLNVGTSLSDINGNPIPFTAVNGSIVPEPSALIQAATALLIGLGVVWRRQRR
jgi:voltage-gated potassium channel Kch